MSVTVDVTADTRLDIVQKFEEHLDARGVSPSTSRKYASLMNGFLTWHEEGRRAEPDAQRMVDWIHARRRGGDSAATTKLRLAAARAYCTYTGIDVKPLADYKSAPLPQRKAHPLPEGIAGVRAMLAEATKPETAGLIALCGLAGLRVNEAITITRADVLKRGNGLVLRVLGKGEKEREVPVSVELEQYLIPLSRDGRLVPMSNSGARAAIAATAIRAGVPGPHGIPVSSHDLRATFATEVHNRTRDIVLVQKLLGHASVTTTQVYIGVDEAHAAAAVRF